MPRGADRDHAGRLGRRQALDPVAEERGGEVEVDVRGHDGELLERRPRGAVEAPDAREHRLDDRAGHLAGGRGEQRARRRTGCRAVTACTSRRVAPAAPGQPRHGRGRERRQGEPRGGRADGGAQQPPQGVAGLELVVAEAQDDEGRERLDAAAPRG